MDGVIAALEAQLDAIKARLDAIEGYITPEALLKAATDRKAKADKAKDKSK